MTSRQPWPRRPGSGREELALGSRTEVRGWEGEAIVSALYWLLPTRGAALVILSVTF